MSYTNKIPKQLRIKDSSPVLNGTPLSEIVSVTGKEFEYNEMTGRYEIKKNNVIVVYDGNSIDKLLKLRTVTVKTLLYLMKLYTAEKQTTYLLDIRDVAKIFVPDFDNLSGAIRRSRLTEFRRDFLSAIDELYNLSIIWKNPIKHKGKDDNAMSRVIAYREKVGNKLYIEVAVALFDIMYENNLISFLPNGVLQLEGKKSHRFTVLTKLATHYTMSSNIKAGRNDIISVKRLLEATGIPTVERMQETNNRNYKEKILKPLENALDDCYPTVYAWEYCKAKKEPFTGEELEYYEKNPLARINECYIRFEVSTEKYPTLKAWNEAPEHKKDQL